MCNINFMLGIKTGAAECLLNSPNASCFVSTNLFPSLRWSVAERGADCRVIRFAADLARSKLCRDLSDLTVDDLVQLYRQEMTDLLDQHCPVVAARRKAKQMTPWFNAECRDACRHARAAERRYRRTCSDVDKRTWLDKLEAMRALYEDVNSNYWRSEIAASSGDTKRLWRTFSGAG